MIGGVYCKQINKVTAVVFVCACMMCVCMHEQYCVSLWMCKCHHPISPPPVSLTSIAISEAAVEAALFWQMLTLSKCISEDVMALVTLPLPVFFAISFFLFFTLPFPCLLWSMHGFKFSIFGALSVLLLMMLLATSYLHAYTNFCYGLSPKFIIKIFYSVILP